MQHRLWLLLITGLAALALILGARAPAEPTETESPVSPPPAGNLSPVRPTPTGSGSAAEAPSPEVSDLAPGVQDLTEQARDDLSQRIDIPVEEIGVQSVEAVQWRDSSLGCPKPGLSYLQVITPGYRIRLQAGGQSYEYHTDEHSVVCCETTEPAGEDMSETERLTAMAKEDLAQRLDVPVEQIQVVSAEYVQWPDASLGCPQPGMTYAQVITPGYRIILSAQGADHEYHTSLRTTTLCED